MKGLHVLNKMSKAVDEYHSKKKPSGHVEGEESKHMDSDGDYDGDKGAMESQVDDKDSQSVKLHEIEPLMCPGCNSKVRAHMAVKAAGSNGVD